MDRFHSSVVIPLTLTVQPLPWFGGQTWLSSSWPGYASLGCLLGVWMAGPLNFHILQAELALSCPWLPGEHRCFPEPHTCKPHSLSFFCYPCSLSFSSSSSAFPFHWPLPENWAFPPLVLYLNVIPLQQFQCINHQSSISYSHTGHLGLLPVLPWWLIQSLDPSAACPYVIPWHTISIWTALPLGGLWLRVNIWEHAYPFVPPGTNGFWYLGC